MFFNQKFDELFTEKEAAFEKIAILNHQLDSVLTELRMSEKVNKLDWNSDEKPEMDLPEDSKEITDTATDGARENERESSGGKEWNKRRQGADFSFHTGLTTHSI